MALMQWTESGSDSLSRILDMFEQGIKTVVTFADDVVTHGFTVAWKNLVQRFSRSSMQNIFMEGDPSVNDEVSYQQKVVRTSSSAYYVRHRLRHEDQIITGISVLPLSKDLQSPEVEVVDGGINYRDVKLKLEPCYGEQWGCDIKIFGSSSSSS
ncbi:hypothetical protein C0J52_26027 [Blattella germanica]|nr:hypothetical protein C0J52_26027 [Blattella germanica]